MKKFKEKYFQDNENNNENLPTIDKFLYKDEHVIEHLTPHQKAFFWSQVFFNLSSILGWLLADGFFVFIFIKTKYYEENLIMFIFLMCFFALLLAPVWTWINKIITAVLKLHHEDYYLTESRVIIRNGYKRIRFNAIPYKDITRMHIKSNLIDRKFQVGDVYIVSEKYRTFDDGREELLSRKQIVIFDQATPQNVISLIKNTAELYKDYPTNQRIEDKGFYEQTQENNQQ